MFTLQNEVPYVFPDAIAFEIMFSVILAISFVLLAKYSSFRKYGVFLIPIGFLEAVFSFGKGFIEGIIISLVTIVGGITIPLFNSNKSQLSKTPVRLSVILSGCAGLTLGAISLYYSDTIMVFYQSAILVIHTKSALLLLAIVLLAVSFYSLIIGIASFIFVKPNKQ